MTSITIRQPNDFHHHLRDGKLLNLTSNECFNRFNYVIVMPNLVPPITTIEQALNYRKEIMKINNKGFPLMTLYLNKNIDIEELRKFKLHNWMGGIKYYPKSATTNSQFGVSNLNEVSHVIKVMEEENIPLLIHGESIKKNIDIFHKERVFLLDELDSIIKNYPK